MGFLSKVLNVVGKVAPLAALVPGIGIPASLALKAASAVAGKFSGASKAIASVRAAAPALRRTFLGTGTRAAMTATGIAATGYLVGQNASTVPVPGRLRVAGSLERTTYGPDGRPVAKKRRKRKKKRVADQDQRRRRSDYRNPPGGGTDTDMMRRGGDGGPAPRRRSRKPPSAAQQRARDEFARRARSGEFKRR